MSIQRVRQINQQRLQQGLPVLVVTDYHCQHLGEFERQERCNCPSRRVPAFECSVHGICTVQRPATDKNIQHCEDCQSYYPHGTELS